ncbi:tryptophan-rich sensory protein [Myxosarcina sp. GI1(2024)]
MEARPQTKNQKPMLRQIVNLIFIIAAFGTNVWANINPPKGLTIGEISNELFGNILITPANYAFAIWGLIYLGLISFAINQALPSQKYDPLLQKIGYSVAIASAAQIIWVFCFLYRQFTWSLVLMLAILLPLIGAYWRLLRYDRSFTPRQKWFIYYPLSIYLAWISVATIVNSATVLKTWDWNGWGLSPVVWTIIMVLIAALITVAATISRTNFAYAGVFVWAAVAIAVRNWNNNAIAIVGIGSAIVVVLALVIRWLRSSKA